MKYIEWIIDIKRRKRKACNVAKPLSIYYFIESAPVCLCVFMLSIFISFIYGAIFSARERMRSFHRLTAISPTAANICPT